jgi:hypothetical protein
LQCGPASSVEIDATVAFSSVAAAEGAEKAGRFHVYLLRGFDYSIVEQAMRKASPRDWWSLAVAGAYSHGASYNDDLSATGKIHRRSVGVRQGRAARDQLGLLPTVQAVPPTRDPR